MKETALARIDDDVLQLLKAYCKKGPEGRKMSSVVSFAVKKYIEEQEAKEKEDFGYKFISR
jgi:hypothetical protein